MSDHSGSPALEPQSTFQSVFSSRYKSSNQLLSLFSEQHRVETWRKLWIWLAEAEKDLGLAITDEQLLEMKLNVGNIDWALAAHKEREKRHDVMAHIETFGEACPSARGILHQGATSAFVQDNTELILMKEAMEAIVIKVARCIDRLAKFARLHQWVTTLGRTHYQAASLTTVGKRACLWIQELVVALTRLEFELSELKFRGVKGATGTYDSFLRLFNGDKAKVRQLNVAVTASAGFSKSFPITGQTYPRLQDAVILNALAVLGAAIHKICADIRILQAFREIQEPFQSTQVGSSAMPYKKNPIRCERACGFARYLMNLAPNALQTASLQGLERTLDDSSNKRIVIPDAFLTADATLATVQNVFEGLIVNEKIVAAHVDEELPFLSMEGVMMELVKTGKSRQEAHEKIRVLTGEASARVMQGESPNLAAMMEADEYFDSIKWKMDELTSPKNFIGLSVDDVDDYLADVVQPILDRFAGKLDGKSELKV